MESGCFCVCLVMQKIEMFEFHLKHLSLNNKRIIKPSNSELFRRRVQFKCRENGRCTFAVFSTHNGVLKYVTCRPPLHAGNRIEDPGGQGSVGDRLGSVASTFLVGDSGFSGACVTQLSATAATAMLREGSGKQRTVTLASESDRKID